MLLTVSNVAFVQGGEEMCNYAEMCYLAGSVNVTDFSQMSPLSVWVKLQKIDHAVLSTSTEKTLTIIYRVAQKKVLLFDSLINSSFSSVMSNLNFGICHVYFNTVLAEIFGFEK